MSSETPQEPILAKLIKGVYISKSILETAMLMFRPDGIINKIEARYKALNDLFKLDLADNGFLDSADIVRRLPQLRASETNITGIVSIINLGLATFKLFSGTQLNNVLKSLFTAIVPVNTDIKQHIVIAYSELLHKVAFNKTATYNNDFVALITEIKPTQLDWLTAYDLELIKYEERCISKLINQEEPMNQGEFIMLWERALNSMVRQSRVIRDIILKIPKEIVEASKQPDAIAPETNMCENTSENTKNNANEEEEGEVELEEVELEEVELEEGELKEAVGAVEEATTKEVVVEVGDLEEGEVVEEEVAEEEALLEEETIEETAAAAKVIEEYTIEEYTIEEDIMEEYVTEEAGAGAGALEKNIIEEGVIEEDKEVDAEEEGVESNDSDSADDVFYDASDNLSNSMTESEVTSNHTQPETHIPQQEESSSFFPNNTPTLSSLLPAKRGSNHVVESDEEKDDSDPQSTHSISSSSSPSKKMNVMTETEEASYSPPQLTTIPSQSPALETQSSSRTLPQPVSPTVNNQDSSATSEVRSPPQTVAEFMKSDVPNPFISKSIRYKTSRLEAGSYTRRRMQRRF